MLLAVVLCLVFLIQGTDANGATAIFNLIDYTAEVNSPSCDEGSSLCDPFFDLCFYRTTDQTCQRILTFATDNTDFVQYKLPTLVLDYTPGTDTRADVDLRDWDGFTELSFHISESLGTFDVTQQLPLTKVTGKALLRSDENSFSFETGARCNANCFGDDCSTVCQEANNPTDGSYTCDENGGIQCRPGYENADPTTPCVTLIGPCTENSCSNGGSCTTVDFNSFFCDCLDGFTGPKCEDPVNPCDVPGRCANGGMCMNGESSDFTCQCLEGFSGDRCEMLVDGCAEGNPCTEGSTCHLGDPGQVLCACAPGFEGETCDDDVDECASDPCKNGGICQQLTPPNFSCSCPPGFNGPLCEGFDSPCLNNPCRHGGDCISSGPGSFSCACPPGYAGNTCEVNIDDCASEPCKNGGTCVDTINGFTCCCKKGYSGTVCQDFEDIIDLLQLTRKFPHIQISKLRYHIAVSCRNVVFKSSHKVQVKTVQDRNCIFGIYHDQTRSK